MGSVARRAWGQQWVAQCQAQRLPVDDTFTLESLTEPVTVRQWGIKGLPLDGVSIENAVIQTRARRWCLMIDPQVPPPPPIVPAALCGSSTLPPSPRCLKAESSLGQAACHAKG